MPISESQLQQQVAQYIRLRYPNALFHSDYGAGVKLTARQGAIQKRQNGGRRAWPDMFIAEIKRVRKMSGIDQYYGCFIELKREGTRLQKKNGDWASEHIAEQAKVLEELRERGYEAQFAVGFDEAKELIDAYMKYVVFVDNTEEDDDGQRI